MVSKKYKLQFTISDYVGGSIKGEFSGGGGSDEYGVLLRSTFLFSPPTFEEDTDDNCFLLP